MRFITRRGCGCVMLALAIAGGIALGLFLLGII